MTNYAKLYARLCGAIDEVLDELGTIPERSMRGKSCKRQFWMRKHSIWTRRKKKCPRETPERVPPPPRGHSFICYSVSSSACWASAPIRARQALVMDATCSGQRPM